MDMLSVRLVAGICLTLCGAGVGIRASEKLAGRVRRLSGMVRLCVRLEGLLTQRLPTGVITGMLTDEGLLPADKGWDGLGADSPEPERGICRRLAEMLGRGDAESQSASVRIAAEQLRGLLESARTEAEEKGKLMMALGTLAGMLCAVLCI